MLAVRTHDECGVDGFAETDAAWLHAVPVRPSAQGGTREFGPNVRDDELGILQRHGQPVQQTNHAGATDGRLDLVRQPIARPVVDLSQRHKPTTVGQMIGQLIMDELVDQRSFFAVGGANRTWPAATIRFRLAARSDLASVRRCLIDTTRTMSFSSLEVARSRSLTA